MNYLRFFVFFTGSVCLIHAASCQLYEYPNVPKDPTENIYFNDTVSDPYQWMENANDPRLSSWLLNQKKISKKFRRKQKNEEDLKARLSGIYSFTSSTASSNYVKEKRMDSSKYVFKRQAKFDNQTPDLLYKIRNDKEYKTLVKIKNHKLDKNDNPIIAEWSVSEENDLLAVQIAHNGVDWRETFFYNLSDGKLLKDTLVNLRSTSFLIWYGRGVYYSSFEKRTTSNESLELPRGERLKYHEIGTKAADDPVVYYNQDTTGANPLVFHYLGGKKVFISHPLLVKKKLYKALGYFDLNASQSFLLHDIVAIPKNDDSNFKPELIIGDSVIISTDWNSPNRRVLIANLNQLNTFREFIPEYDMTLLEINRFGKNKVACIYQKEDRNYVTINSIDGKEIKLLSFPKGKKVNSFYENDTTKKYSDFYVSAFYHPNLWYQISLDDFTAKPSENVIIPYDHSKIETRYIKYKSTDGTEIPMYITCLKSIKLNKKNPTLIYGYGGYGNTISPVFNKEHLLWVLKGGVLAIPSVRGGGAKGSAWSQMGRRLNKQNAINDFISAAEYLVESKYTNPQRIASNGGSHGGMLVTAAAIQRPDLFHSVIAESGPYDMLRFEQFTVGGISANLNEFGTTANRTDYENLKSYSPLHNIKEGVKYPNFLLITGDSDDRVPPLHSFKFLATLQEKAANSSLYQIYVIPDAGHQGALTNEDWVDKILFKYSYLYSQLGVEL